jgi:hypothetical protein
VSVCINVDTVCMYVLQRGTMDHYLKTYIYMTACLHSGFIFTREGPVIEKFSYLKKYAINEI